MVNNEIFKLFLKIVFTLVLYFIIFLSASLAMLQSRIFLAMAIMYIGYWLSYSLQYYIKKPQDPQDNNYEDSNNTEPNNNVSQNEEAMNNPRRPSNVFTISSSYNNVDQRYWNLNEHSELPPRYETLYSVDELPPSYETAVKDSKSVI